ncbi:MAG: phenylacetate--CoA ligase PaaK [Halalkalicoccus sp.]
MIYDERESLSRDELTALQSERLRETLAHAVENVPFYRERFADAGVEWETIDSIEEISVLPFTTKEDLRKTYPDGMIAVAHDRLRRIHASSGTTGKPKIVAYTEADLDLWSEVMARSLAAAGVSPGDTVQNAYGYGLFTGGLGVHYGVERLGATVIPIGGGQTQRQIDLLVDLESDVLTCTPSYALYLAETAEESGRDPRAFSLSTVIVGAEPCTQPMRAAIEAALDVTVVDIYGLSELIGPGVSNECHEARNGLHVWEDHFYPEVVDPRTGDVLPAGEEGELVLTSLTKEALPIIRYRTGDLTTLDYGVCDCGRTMVRMDNVTGRSDDLLVVRGVNVYPSQIESVVLEFDAVAPHYRIDLEREGQLDTIEITAELAPGFDGEPGALEERIRDRLEAVLSLSPDALSLVEPGGIERTEVGKVQRVYDHRV